jgi:SAM-dependent methyltransferase
MHENGLLVFDAPRMGEGGLTYGQNYLRVLLQGGIPPCERVLDLCAGPGYIGFRLLANGFCRTLALAEINPDACALARHTIEYNRIGNLAQVYESDGLDGIPEHERFDLVVCNGPSGECDQTITHNNDPDWGLRRRVYGSIKRFLNPGGRCVIQEFRCDSTVDDFAPMIRAGGGKVIGVIGGTDLRGAEISTYYIVSSFD